MKEQIDKALYVDNDICALNIWERVLRTQYNVDIAISGIDGLRMIEENGPYAVIIADVNLPDTHGHKFLSEVKNITPETVCIMFSDSVISIYNDYKSKYEVIKKPCEIEDLLNIIDERLQYYKTNTIVV